MQNPENELWESVRCPGLTPAAVEVERLVQELSKKWTAYAYKEFGSLAWVIFVGGTGTGKSTLFNVLCGETLSEAGLERPKTFGPIAYVHRHAAIEAGFPFSSMEIRRLGPKDYSSLGHSGKAGELLVLEHERDELSHLVLVDLPDMDSLEVKNRRTVEDLYLLCDMIVFVTSQEKYADDVPFRFLQRIHRDGKPVLLVLNKAEPRLTLGELLATTRDHGLDLGEGRSWILPYFPSNAAERLARSGELGDFAAAFFRALAKSRTKEVLHRERKRAAGELAHEMRRFLDLLHQEQEAIQKWIEHLDIFLRSACHDLFAEQENHFSQESKEYLQNEIRKLYSRYDLLQKPRRMIAEIVLAPLRLLGLGRAKPQESREAILRKVRQRLHVTPILAAVAAFNRSVLEQLSPADEKSALFGKLRDRSLMLTDDQVRQHVLEEQDRLIRWLEERFEEMARGLSKSKQWSIYSTSILWGGLILSLEVAIGGGISMLEAVLDSAVAPFVTKGAVELFAYQELKKLARELAERYRESLVSVVRRQRDSYAACLESLTTPEETLASLRSLGSSIG
jgi:energy-coupling factor transporter ATP-binding protein EcfA2